MIVYSFFSLSLSLVSLAQLSRVRISKNIQFSLSQICFVQEREKNFIQTHKAEFNSRRVAAHCRVSLIFNFDGTGVLCRISRLSGMKTIQNSSWKIKSSNSVESEESLICAEKKEKLKKNPKGLESASEEVNLNFDRMFEDERDQQNKIFSRAEIHRKEKLKVSQMITHKIIICDHSKRNNRK